MRWRRSAGTPFTLKISVFDAYGNRVKNYFGTIHFTNTVGLPTDYTFNSNDVGVHSFTIPLITVGDQRSRQPTIVTRPLRAVWRSM